MKIQSVSELADKVAQDPKLSQAIAENPVDTIASLAAPLQSDVWVYRIVVGALSMAITLALIGAILLTGFDKDVPETIVAIGSAAVGALAGLLAPSPVASRQS